MSCMGTLRLRYRKQSKFNHDSVEVRHLDSTRTPHAVKCHRFSISQNTTDSSERHDTATILPISSGHSHSLGTCMDLDPAVISGVPSHTSDGTIGVGVTGNRGHSESPTSIGTVRQSLKSAFRSPRLSFVSRSSRLCAERASMRSSRQSPGQILNDKTRVESQSNAIQDGFDSGLPVFHPQCRLVDLPPRRLSKRQSVSNLLRRSTYKRPCEPVEHLRNAASRIPSRPSRPPSELCPDAQMDFKPEEHSLGRISREHSFHRDAASQTRGSMQTGDDFNKGPVSPGTNPPMKSALHTWDQIVRKYDQSSSELNRPAGSQSIRRNRSTRSNIEYSEEELEALTPVSSILAHAPPATGTRNDSHNAGMQQNTACSMHRAANSRQKVGDSSFRAAEIESDDEIGNDSENEPKSRNLPPIPERSSLRNRHISRDPPRVRKEARLRLSLDLSHCHNLQHVPEGSPVKLFSRSYKPHTYTAENHAAHGLGGQQIHEPSEQMRDRFGNADDESGRRTFYAQLQQEIDRSTVQAERHGAQEHVRFNAVEGVKCAASARTNGDTWVASRQPSLRAVREDGEVTAAPMARAGNRPYPFAAMVRPTSSDISSVKRMRPSPSPLCNTEIPADETSTKLMAYGTSERQAMTGPVQERKYKPTNVLITPLRDSLVDDNETGMNTRDVNNPDDGWD